MNQEYDNNLSGVLFKNDRKQTEKQPDYKGQAEVEGVEYWLAAWVKESRNGRKFLKLAFTEKDEGGQAPARRQKQAAPPVDDPVDMDGSDIPF